MNDPKLKDALTVVAARCGFPVYETIVTAIRRGKYAAQAEHPANVEDALKEYDRAIERGADHASAVEFMLDAIRRVDAKDAMIVAKSWNRNLISPASSRRES